jgi:hypothetical protein
MVRPANPGRSTGVGRRETPRWSATAPSNKTVKSPVCGALRSAVPEHGAISRSPIWNRVIDRVRRNIDRSRHRGSANPICCQLSDDVAPLCVFVPHLHAHECLTQNSAGRHSPNVKAVRRMASKSLTYRGKFPFASGLSVGQLLLIAEDLSVRNGRCLMILVMLYFKDEADMKVGDHVRRRGLLAEMFGDEEGTVVDVRHGPEKDKFQVKFGTRLVVYSAQQIILS